MISQQPNIPGQCLGTSESTSNIEPISSFNSLPANKFFSTCLSKFSQEKDLPMAEWSQLPKELLDVIAQRLESPFDILRFRSVCSTWRSSVPPKPRRLPNCFPILPNGGISTTTWGFFLSKRTVFRLQSTENPTSDPNAWLVKIEEDTPERMHLLNPLTRSQFKPLPETFPKILDLSRIRVSELGQEYVLQYINYRPFSNFLGDAGNLYMEKVAFCSNSDGYVLLTIHVSGKLAMFRSGDKIWTVIEDMPSPYDDVIFFNGKFYAVDSTGRTVVVELNSTLNLIAHSVFGGDKKYLVESSGELLLVDMYLSLDTEEAPGYGAGDEIYEQFDQYLMSERIVRFKVFKLDEKGQKWVEVKSLRDWVLFLGDNITFSALASDFPGCKGNCIYFTDNFFYSMREEDSALNDRGICVFDLENGSIGALIDHPGYSKLFWPPPSWVTSTRMETIIHFSGQGLKAVTTLQSI